MPGGGTILDSLWIALGIRVEGDGLKEVKAQVNEAKESLISAGAALKTFIAGFAIHEIAKIGSTFEQNQIQIAGFISGLSDGTKDFKQGMVDAQGVIQQITKDAAILPGEAQEYIDVFKAGLPFVQGAMPGGSLSDVTAFTNKLTAIGKTFGLDSGLIAREFDHMLSPGKGMASLRLPLFRQLMSFMPKMANGARVTAEAFNAMSAPARLKILSDTFEKLQPMLDASANSFDAMWGAAVSAVKQMTRVATAPLFKGMKVALDQINAAFYDTTGKLTAFGQGVVDAVGTGTKYLTQFLTMAGHVVMWFAKSKAGAVALKVALGLLGTALAGLALEKTVSSFGKLFGVMGNIKSLLTGGLLALLALVAEDLYQFYTGGNSVTGLLLKRFPQIAAAFQQIKSVAVDVFGFIKASVLVLTTVFGALGDAIGDATDADVLTAFVAEWNLAKPLIIAGAAAIAIALAGAFAPVYAAVIALGAIVVAIDQIAKKKGFFYGRVQSMGKALAGAVAAPFGGLAGSPDLGGAGVLAADPTADLASRYSWSPGGTGPTNNATSNQTNTFNIQSTDPKGAADEVARVLTRNAQTKTKL